MNEAKILAAYMGGRVGIDGSCPSMGGNMAFGNTGPKGLTWYANSPSGISPPTAAHPLGSDTGTALRKFVDSLAGLQGGATGANNLGQYIPVAVRIHYVPGFDYYELGVVQYNEQVHS